MAEPNPLQEGKTRGGAIHYSQRVHQNAKLKLNELLELKEDRSPNTKKVAERSTEYTAIAAPTFIRKHSQMN